MTSMFEDIQGQIKDKKFLCAYLERNGITRVTQEYHGSGDSGDFDSPEFEPLQKWKLIPSEHKSSVMDAFESLFTDNLQESIGIDWWNNEGGYGKCELDVLKGEAYCHTVQEQDEMIWGEGHYSWEYDDDEAFNIIKSLRDRGLERIKFDTRGDGTLDEIIPIPPMTITDEERADLETLSRTLHDRYGDEIVTGEKIAAVFGDTTNTDYTNWADVEVDMRLSKYKVDYNLKIGESISGPGYTEDTAWIRDEEDED